MKQMDSSRDHSVCVKGLKMLLDIQKKYKHRLPDEFYQEQMLQVADILCGLKLYQLALWQGYSLYLLQFSSVQITDITDVDHFNACYFPEGFGLEQRTFTMKTHAMIGCTKCIFEEEKKCSTLSQKGLCKLLKLLNFIRIMMQAFQQHEHLFWQIYNGSLFIYNICRYLMTMNYSEQALEYLLWASISLELSVPLMTARYLPLITALYCSVCQCYYDNQAKEQAEEFANRALGKINELAKLETPTDATNKEAQKAYREASVKLGALVFKRAVFNSRGEPKTIRSLKDIPNAPWPRTLTETMLISQFDCTAGQFLAILEALWDSSTRPLHITVPDNAETQTVVLELLSAGMSILSGVKSTGKQSDDKQYLSPNILTSASTLIDLAIKGENQVSVMSAVRFIKLLFNYNQPEEFSELTKAMLHHLSGLEGQPFRKAEVDLNLLHCFKNLLFSQGDSPKEDKKDDTRGPFSYMSNEFLDLVDTLRLSTCGSDSELWPDPDLSFDAFVFLWSKLRMIMQIHHLEAPESQHDRQKIDSYGKCLWCLSVLSEVALTCELANVDCIMTAEMHLMLGKQLEKAADRINQTEESAVGGYVKVKPRPFSLLERSNTDLLKKVCEVTKKAQEALSKGVSALIPLDHSAITDTACMQKYMSPHPSTVSSTTTSEEKNRTDESSFKAEEEKETKTESENKGHQDTESKHLFILVKDLYLQLDIIYVKASVKLLQLNEVTESDLLDRIKRNKVSKAHLMIQKASVEHSRGGPNESSKIKSLLEEATILIEKAELEERKIYMANVKNPGRKKDKAGPGENSPAPPILLSRTDNSFTFAPAPYDLERQVSWYQLCGRAVQGINQKVRLGDCSIPGTGILVPVVSGECFLMVKGLQSNQKYVFAVAAYDSQGKLLGDAIGDTTLPIIACMPVPLLCTWAYLAQVAFQTEQYAVSKKACRKLWSHYTDPDCLSKSELNRFSSTRLRKETLQNSSPHLCQMFLASIFTETEINVQQASLHWASFSNSGPFIWEQEAKIAECERMLLAIDLAMYLNDGRTALRAVVTCYMILAPLIYYQISCDPVVQVLRKCLVFLKENSSLLKQRGTGYTSESIMHMVGCITYYLSKVQCNDGHNLLQELFKAHSKPSTLPWQANKAGAQAANDGLRKIRHQIKALHVKNKKSIVSKTKLNKDTDILSTTVEDPTLLYELLSRCTLQDSYNKVMKLTGKTYFLEFAVLLLQRTLEEGRADLVLICGQNIHEVLSRKHKEMLGQTKNRVRGISNSKGGSNSPATKIRDLPQNVPTYEHTQRKLKTKIPHSLLKNLRTNREILIVENSLAMMSNKVYRHRRLLKLRNLTAKERAWRSFSNYCMAMAHLAQFYQGLELMHGTQLEQRYSQLGARCLSFAYSGIIMRKDSLPSSENKLELKKNSCLREDILKAGKQTTHKEAVRDDVSITKEIIGEREGSFKSQDKSIETSTSNFGSLLDSVKNAALYLRRAMVLAHRGSHWTTLQYVCQTLWDQNNTFTSMVQQVALQEKQPPVLADQLHAIFTPILVLAIDLMLDMLDKLQIWRLYDLDSTVEELESCLHFSAPLDDCLLVDLRWVRTLVFYTLEQLYDCGKWETLAHFALLYNSYTRERYVLSIAPLLVHSQRKLLERIASFGGPAVPQPHHVKTQKATGEKITYRNYASCQLLSGWTQYVSQEEPTAKKDALSLKASEMQRSMSLVCVPLDVEDTLSCYREALDKSPHCLQVLQHSRSLVVQLLAGSQLSQFPNHQDRSLSLSPTQATFSPAVLLTPNLLPHDLHEDDFRTPSAIYRHPISLKSIPVVAAAYLNSIKDLHANGHDSLQILALHEMGNLRFFAGNISAAHSCWSKAVDRAFQSSGVIQKWDGVSFQSTSLQNAVKRAGIWGCLQGAVLTAKIAQFVLTSDIDERTNCCLLSAHFFKSVLDCSLAHPQSNIQYASYTFGDELFPGVNLFSEPHRLQIDTTVTSLHFLCYWLFTTGYYLTLLPILALYIHLVGPVCRDVQRTAEAKILKVRALTELCMFTEAITEAVQLIQGADLMLPSGLYFPKKDLQPVRKFCSNKSLPDNLEALEDLMNCDFTSEVCKLYGPTLCSRFQLARIQLIIAITKSEPGSSVSGSEESCDDTKNKEVDRECDEQERREREGSSPKAEILLCNEKEKPSPERIKCLLLEGASTLLSSAMQQFTSHRCSEAENLELTLEFNLLKANLFLQQGNFALSSEIAVSCLVLLQTSPVIVRPSPPGSEQDAKDCSVSQSLDEDSPRAVEARERTGALLWLRCRLALIHSLTASLPSMATLFPGKNINKDIAVLIQEGMDECVQWGDRDIQALLMVQAAELEAQIGRTDESMATLQKAVNLLLERACMPPWSVLTLAQATLLFSDLKNNRSSTLLQLTRKLLEKQLFLLGQNLTSIDGNMKFSPPGPRNIYLPFLSMLNRINGQIGK
ncbi:PREDICTED: cilia- and flagella-associated protein 54 [Cyprinodon variegatus]|uniref:cilia- and flagella-associated protein 54 n=1 Tax=Cyprinodon variegatus TaxID=28743 RepID=UPI000742C835|nr:PREDICTED: cilia- and flagella-associated protein 54 [Cyprinodon variegatus]